MFQFFLFLFLGLFFSPPPTFFGASAFTLYRPSQLILTLHLLIRQVPTRELVPSATPLLFVSCNDWSHTVQESFPINTASTFVGAFNTEVTSSPWTIYTPYPRISPILLAFSSEGALEVAFDDISTFLSKSWEAEDRVVLSCIYRPSGLSLFVLGNPYPRHRPWVLMESGPSCEFFGPTDSISLNTLCRVA